MEAAKYERVHETSGIPRGRLALVFVAPYDGDTHIVNFMTGRYGYGHVALWAGHMQSHQPMLLDSGIGYGVGFRSANVATGGAQTRTVDLDVSLSRWVWRRALSFVGCEYDYVGLVRGRQCEKFTCSGLVATCLPAHMRFELPPKVSPNDLARYFGAPTLRRAG